MNWCLHFHVECPWFSLWKWDWVCCYYVTQTPEPLGWGPHRIALNLPFESNWLFEFPLENLTHIQWCLSTGPYECALVIRHATSLKTPFPTMWSHPSRIWNFGSRDFATLVAKFSVLQLPKPKMPFAEMVDVSSSTLISRFMTLGISEQINQPHVFESVEMLNLDTFPKYWPHNRTFHLSEFRTSRFRESWCKAPGSPTCETPKWSMNFLTSPGDKDATCHFTVLYLWHQSFFPFQAPNSEMGVHEGSNDPRWLESNGPISPEIEIIKALTLTPLAPLRDLTALTSLWILHREFCPLDSTL
jgi:hypothetical protein